MLFSEDVCGGVLLSFCLYDLLDEIGYDLDSRYGALYVRYNLDIQVYSRLHSDPVQCYQSQYFLIRREVVYCFISPCNTLTLHKSTAERKSQ